MQFPVGRPMAGLGLLVPAQRALHA